MCNGHLYRVGIINLSCFLGGEDYEPVVQLLLTFSADSERMNFVDILLFPDNTTEETETFSLVATSLDPSVSILVNETVISIIDNDSESYCVLSQTAVMHS